jgi:hypothetical protein
VHRLALVKEFRFLVYENVATAPSKEISSPLHTHKHTITLTSFFGMSVFVNN